MTVNENDIEAQYAWTIFKETKQLQRILVKRYYYEFIKLKQSEEYFVEELVKELPF